MSQTIITVYSTFFWVESTPSCQSRGTESPLSLEEVVSCERGDECDKYAICPFAH